MKTLLLALALAGSLFGAPAIGRAHDAYDDSQSHPLQLLAYAVHPVGYAIEWLVMRPLHFLVSQPQLEPITGHGPHESAFGSYEIHQPEHR